MTLRSGRMLVLGWHNIEGTPCFPSEPGAGLRGFCEQLDWLERWANVVPLSETLARLRAGRPIPPRAVAITFDDGYRDNLELAAPELRRRDMPATFFLVPSLLDRRVEPWWEQIAWAVSGATTDSATIGDSTVPLDGPGGRAVAHKELAELLKHRDLVRRRDGVSDLLAQLSPRLTNDLSELFLDWDGARELARQGFEIGSHSRDHAILSEETPDAQESDLADSRSALEAGLGVPVRAVAYPNGTRRDYDSATIAAAESAGYECGVTTVKGLTTRRTPRFQVRRVVVYPERGTRIVRTAAQVAWTRAARAARSRVRPARPVVRAGRAYYGRVP